MNSTEFPSIWAKASLSSTTGLDQEAKLKLDGRLGPLEIKRNPALANLLDKYIVVTGGRYTGRLMGKTCISMTVQVYDIVRDMWERGPELNRGRESHSSCVLGTTVYVFGGVGSSGLATLNCIEQW